jgi:hypothetical protein
MPLVDRLDVLNALEQRHDLLTRELDELNERVDIALAAYGLAPREEPNVPAPSSSARAVRTKR